MAPSTEVVEVVARFGPTIIDVAHLGAGETYRIGSAPDVDLPVQIAGLASFPLVADRVVRCPSGVETRTLGDDVELSLGDLTISVVKTSRPHVPVPRPRLDRRPLVFTFISLALHVALWASALTFAPFERLAGTPAPRPATMRFVHVEAKSDLPPEPTPSAVIAAEAQRKPARTPGLPPRRPEVGIGTSQLLGVTVRLADQFDAIDVRGKLEALDGPTYDEDAANAEGFGGKVGRLKMPPTVKTGRFGTVAAGVGAGDFYDPFLPPDPAQKTRLRIEEATAQAGESARRGDCVPAHRIARMVKRLDLAQYQSVYLADKDVAHCLTQPVPPARLKPE